MNSQANKLRLIITHDCNRDCPGCCNKDINMDSLDTIEANKENFNKYEEIYITGGEPMLYPHKVIALAKQMIEVPFIAMYTAKVNHIGDAFDVLDELDGMTLTLHHQNDVANFIEFNELLVQECMDYKSLRLNVFKGILLEGDFPLWEIKSNIEWIKDCPLPEGEELKILL